MRAEEAATIARRIVNIWRATPSLAEWQDKLADYDYDDAAATLRLLRDEQDGSLSIARFHATHRARTTPASSITPDRCELCDGTGWVEGPGVTLGTQHYTNVIRCRCRP